jgi:aerobic-type carbon monoxide dehydrogenase small subunit (CoxS/CutS family)
VATNLKLAQEEWADNKALCAYCQAASIISMVSLVLALPEASRGLRALRR